MNDEFGHGSGREQAGGISAAGANRAAQDGMPSRHDTGAAEQRLTGLLVEYDEALAAGDTSAAALDTQLPRELATELASLQECVQLLNAARVERQCRVAVRDAGRAGQVVVDEQTPLAGERIGRFELLRELGRGGYGVVFLARDPHLDRLVALKVPRPEGLVTPELRRRFLREAHLAGRLSHAHLVRVHEVGEDGAVCFIVSEYCPGPSLAQWLKQNEFPAAIRESAALVADLADALQYAHAEGVLHRDIKPGNVLLDPKRTGVRPPDATSTETLLLSSYTAKLADFGLAKLLTADDHETRAGTQLGTPAYMSPEQAAGQQSQIGPAADVYGLGAILYELLARRAPFIGSSDAETLRQVIADEPVAPRKLRPDVPTDLEAICLKCLEKKPAARYASCAALADDLRRFLAGEPTRARPAGPAERLSKWARRRPALAALVAVSILAAVTIVAGSAEFSRRLLVALDASEQSRVAEIAAHAKAEASRDATQRERDANEQFAYAGRMQQAFQAIAQGGVRQVASLLAQYEDGTPYEGLRGFEWHYLKQALHDERLMLRGHEGEVYGVAFSPDGRFLVSGGQDGTIRLWDPQSGQELRTIHAHASCTNDLDFSPDGRLLASASCDRTAKIWDTNTWQESATFRGHDHDVLCVAFSPDGQSLASGDSSGKTCVWTVGETTLRSTIVPDLSPRMKKPGAVNSVAWSPDGKRLLAPTSDNCWLWDTASWTQVDSWPASGSHSAVISPDGQWVAFDSLGEITIRNIATDGGSTTISKRGRPVQRVSYSSDGRQLLSCGDDGVVRIWAIASGADQDLSVVERDKSQHATELRALVGHMARVQDLTVSPDGQTLATASFDGSVGLWDLAAKGEAVPVLTCNGAMPSAPALAPDLSRFVALANNDQIVTWDVTKSREIGRHEVGTVEDRAIFLSSDARTFVFRNQKTGLLSFGQTADVNALVTPGTPYAMIHRVVFSGDGQSVAMVHDDGWVRVYDVRSGREKEAFKAITADSDLEKSFLAGGTVLALSNDGRRLAMKCGRNVMLDLETGERTELPQPEGLAAELSFSPDDRLLAIRCHSGNVHLIDARSGAMLHTLRLPSPTTAIAMSPDSRTLALALAAGDNVTLWHVETGQEMGSFRTCEESGDIVKLQFSADGRKLAAITNKPIDDTHAEASLYIW